MHTSSIAFALVCITGISCARPVANPPEQTHSRDPIAPDASPIGYPERIAACRALLRTHMGEIRSCMAERAPDVHRTIEMKVAANGTVSVSVDPPEPSINQCLSNSSRLWNLGPGAAATVREAHVRWSDAP